MTGEPAWPLHPPPKEIETLRQYVQSLGRVDEVDSQIG